MAYVGFTPDSRRNRYDATKTTRRANKRHPHQFAAHRPGQRRGMPPNFEIELRLLTIAAASDQMPAGVAAKWQRATVSENCSPK